MSRRSWNRLAGDFETTVCDVTRSSGRQLAELVRRTRPSRDKTLVDAGCGIGSFMKRFGRRFGTRDGVRLRRKDGPAGTSGSVPACRMFPGRRWGSKMPPQRSARWAIWWPAST